MVAAGGELTLIEGVDTIGLTTARCVARGGVIDQWRRREQRPRLVCAAAHTRLGRDAGESD